MTGLEDTRRLVATLVLLAMPAGILTFSCWNVQLPFSQWWQAAFTPDLDDPRQLVFHFSALPRATTAILAGTALGTAGLLLQQVLRNPLASPTTLGLEAGSQLAMTVALVMAPSLLDIGREWIALAGALIALGFVLLCAMRNRFSSIALVLAGLVTGLLCGALTVALHLLDQEYVSVLFLWGSGSLAQQDWSAPLAMAPRIGILLLLASIATRPLSVLSLDDENARSLGLPVAWIRGAGVVLAALLTATVTANVGVIGFVGLAAPQIAQFSGARRFLARLVVAPLVGALLVLSVDGAVGLLETVGVVDLPTGAATALLGAPLLIWLLPRLRRSDPPAVPSFGSVQLRNWPALVPALAGLLTLAILVAFFIGRTGGGWPAEGWHFTSLGDLIAVAPWRIPRTLVVMFAGAMLAAAGLLLQRITGNPLAAPEVLGIGTGVAFGMVLSLILAVTPSAVEQTLAGAVGGFAALALVLLASRKSGFAPDHILLVGIALSALLDAVVVAFLALGDPRATQLLSWIAGSSYAADWPNLMLTAILATALLPSTLVLTRWLDILPLGDAVTRSIGLPLPRVRLAIMGIASLLTASAVMATGPLTFVGLAGPHIARLIGVRRAVPQIVVSALIGALIMVVADTLARTVIAPRQLPAGLVAALIGLPYLVWQLGRKRS
ncbi:Fe(3+)-hydroxamate ABC transporter permease FhuB [Labrys monachus]|uniref:Iron complex transport system permease protein n=1 Tax=Labrys monachus TaxID=217067 RepID=A0ABU0FHN5_9HYPH|nr:Fe(3+)-hydroxamate ABC transporter permease FhuB [Labrys monachus]MDQ0393585.1 iron complex transport system permease protein [Labrys monachus]